MIKKLKNYIFHYRITLNQWLQMKLKNRFEYLKSKCLHILPNGNDAMEEGVFFKMCSVCKHTSKEEEYNQAWKQHAEEQGIDILQNIK